MNVRVGARIWSAALVGSAGTAAATAGCWWLVALAQQGSARSASGPAGPLLTVTAVLAAAVCVRVALTCLACAAYAWSVVARRSRSARETPALCARMAVRLSPGLLRPVVATLVAGGLALGSAGTATAAGLAAAPPPAVTARAFPVPRTATGPLPDPAWSLAAGGPTDLGDLPTAGWTPRRPAAAPGSQPDLAVLAATAVRVATPAPVVVHRGDTLWSIAARHLGPGATDADVAEQWPRWWQANRTTIGDDPDLLVPGQVLVRPGAEVDR